MSSRSQKSKVKGQKSAEPRNRGTAESLRSQKALSASFLRLFCVFALSALVLLLAGCKLDDGVLRRSAADYFPLRTGSEWRYDLGGTTSLVQVRGDSMVHNYPVTVVLRDYEEEYWLESQGDVRRFVDTVGNCGTDYPLEQRFRRFYVLPFVLGNSWSDDFDDTLDVLGETIHYRHRIDGKVTAIAPVTVPAGSFADCYEVDLNELKVVNDSDTVSTHTQEWYAPGIGLVKRVRGSSEELLTEDSIP